MSIQIESRVLITDKMFDVDGKGELDGFNGKTGTVKTFDGGTLPYGVLVDGMEDEGVYHFNEEELEVIQ